MGCLKYPAEQRTEISGKTVSVAGPVYNHSPGLPQVPFGEVEQPRQKIKLPFGRNKSAWEELDAELVRGASKLAKNDPSIKPFTDFIYNHCFTKFGPAKKAKNEARPISRRQQEISRLKRERKQLRRRWKGGGSTSDESAGLSALWREVNEKLGSLRRAEKAGKRRSERRRARRDFFTNPFRYSRSLLDPPKSGLLTVDRGVLEEHLALNYSDEDRFNPMEEKDEVPRVPPPACPFNESSPSFMEVKRILMKTRNRSAPGPNGIPYLVYKRCPRLFGMLFARLKIAWSQGRVDDEWKTAEGVYIPKEKNSSTLDQFRPISLLNVEGKIFFSFAAGRLIKFLLDNKYVDTSIQKGGVPGIPGCIEHISTISEAISRARKKRLNLHVVWLDLANAYGSVPHRFIWWALRSHHVPEPLVGILIQYFKGFRMRFTTKTFTTKWIELQIGIAMGCSISPCLFVLAMQVLLRSMAYSLPEVRLDRGVSMPPLKAYMDDTTLLTNNADEMQAGLDRFDNLVQWCRMKFKPAKSRSLSLLKGKLREDVSFTVAGQVIPTVSDEAVKSLGKVFDSSLRDKGQELATLLAADEGLRSIDSVPLAGRFKVWILQFVLLPRLLWPLMIYDIGVTAVEKLEKKLNKHTRKWFGLPPAITDVALYGRSNKLKLPLKSIAEECRVAKIRMQLLLNESADARVRDVEPTVRGGRIFNTGKEISESIAELTFEDMRGQVQLGRHGVGWKKSERWSIAGPKQRTSMIIAERRRSSEQKRVTKAVQQAQQGRWTTWTEVTQRTICWSEIWKMSPVRLSFIVRSVYDQMPSKENLKRWKLADDSRCSLCDGEETLAHVLTGCKVALARGRYTWRHNLVLQAIVDATEVARIRANEVTNEEPNRRIYFLREGQKRSQERQRPSGERCVLSLAKDWTISADLREAGRYPLAISCTGKRPDLVLFSQVESAMVLVELTVPWEDRMDTSNALKTKKYEDLVEELETQGFAVSFFAVEVGARGLPGRSLTEFLHKIGLSNRECKVWLHKISEAAESASLWIWNTRGRL